MNGAVGIQVVLSIEGAVLKKVILKAGILFLVLLVLWSLMTHVHDVNGHENEVDETHDDKDDTEPEHDVADGLHVDIVTVQFRLNRAVVRVQTNADYVDNHVGANGN